MSSGHLAIPAVACGGAAAIGRLSLLKEGLSRAIPSSSRCGRSSMATISEVLSDRITAMLFPDRGEWRFPLHSLNWKIFFFMCLRSAIEERPVVSVLSCYVVWELPALDAR